MSTKTFPSIMRVASVPHGHVYVQHLADPDRSDGVMRLEDPAPPDPVVGAPWWPAVMLDAEWIADNADSFDIYHLHFGFDAIEPEGIARIVAALWDKGKPLVYTVHDLRNPHHADPGAHEKALDVLIPAADALITLTDGAAQQIMQRWRRRAEVIRHPHVVSPHLLARPRPARDRRTVGIHLKSLRANLDPIPVLEVLLAEAPKYDMDVLVDVRTDVVTPGMRNHDPAVTGFLRDIGRFPGVAVRVHDYFSDDELWDYFMSLDLWVLPYSFGTHSGWLEACFDLGTRVLAPRIGHYHEQQNGVLGYRLTRDGKPRAQDLAAALETLTGPGGWRANPKQRLAERRLIASAHRRLYERLLHRAA